MPAEFTIESERDAVLTRAWGTLSDEDLLDHQRRLRAHPEFRPDMRQLMDFTEVEEDLLTADGIRRMAENNPFDRTAKRAFVLRERAATYGMTRMFGTLTDSTRLRPFDDRAAAEAWLFGDEDDV